MSIKNDKYKWYNYLNSKSINELKELKESFMNNPLKDIDSRKDFIEQTILKIDIVLNDKLSNN